eukprot:Awhi_evm1s4532
MNFKHRPVPSSSKSKYKDEKRLWGFKKSIAFKRNKMATINSRSGLESIDLLNSLKMKQTTPTNRSLEFQREQETPESIPPVPVDIVCTEPSTSSIPTLNASLTENAESIVLNPIVNPESLTVPETTDLNLEDNINTELALKKEYIFENANIYHNPKTYETTYIKQTLPTTKIHEQTLEQHPEFEDDSLYTSLDYFRNRKMSNPFKTNFLYT